MQKDTGEEVSTREIKSILQECIDNESKRKPLNDDELTQILNDKGYEIAPKDGSQVSRTTGYPRCTGCAKSFSRMQKGYLIIYALNFAL